MISERKKWYSLASWRYKLERIMSSLSCMQIGYTKAGENRVEEQYIVFGALFKTVLNYLGLRVLRFLLLHCALLVVVRNLGLDPERTFNIDLDS
jgi:hypothetical protein